MYNNATFVDKAQIKNLLDILFVIFVAASSLVIFRGQAKAPNSIRHAYNECS